MAQYPILVDWCGICLGFSQVAGLIDETEIGKMQESCRPKKYKKIKKNGMEKFGYITLNQGIFASEDEYSIWINNANLSQPSDAVISLLDENQKTIIKFKVKQAFLLKLSPTFMGVGNKEVVIESITLVHHGVEIKNG